MLNLEGKAIIITGAGRGLGAAYARYFAEQGAKVVVNDVDAPSAIEVAARITGNGGQAIAHAADVCSWRAAGGLAECCLDSFGSLDGLVNNAGVFRMGRLDEMTEGYMDGLVQVNIIGTANCAAHACKAMLRQGKGAIVNVTSGAHMGIPAMGFYGATKGAVASFTYTWAMELQGSGVRVNAVSPLAKTDMGDLPYLRARGIEPHQLQIGAEVNAPAVAYLLSDKSAAVNGQILRIEGKLLALVVHPAVQLPILERDVWTFEAVAQAFEDEFANSQVPLGITGLKVDSYHSGSKFWAKTAGAK